MRTRIISVLGALLVLLALAPIAHACSCFAGDPRTRLEKSDGAFIGKLVSVDPAPPTAQSTTYHFKVDDVFKGDIGSTVDVESSTNGASCGFEVPPGEQMGFFLDRDGSVWRGGLCGQVAPEDLRKAAAPLPKPNGSGPLTFLVGGAYGDVRTLGLDAEGKTLRYGKGDGKATRVSVCPGSRVAAEVYTADESYDRTYLAVRDLETFDVLRKSRVAEFDHPVEGRALMASAVACRSASGDDVLVYGSNYAAEEDSIARLVRVRPDEHTELWEGKGVSAALPMSGSKAYVASSTLKLVEVDLSTGAGRDVAKIPDFSESGLALSPDGRHVASLGRGYPKTDVYVADVASGDVKTTTMASGGGSGHMVWVSNDRVVATGGGENGQDVIVFDASLKRIGSWTGWTAAYRTISVDGTLYGTSFGTLVKAPALKGPMKELRKLDSPELEAIAAVPPAPPAPEASPTARPTATTEPTTAPTTTPETTASRAGFAAPASAPSEPTGGSAVPAAALAVSALALGGAAFTWRRRSG